MRYSMSSLSEKNSICHYNLGCVLQSVTLHYVKNHLGEIKNTLTTQFSLILWGRKNSIKLCTLGLGGIIKFY